MSRPSYTNDNRFVAYYRVSTKKQGRSGLGLGDQRSSVRKFIARNGNRIIAEFTEVESGKHDNRPKLTEAIELAKDQDATLVIAKLDRLSRRVGFISDLMDSGVKFVCADMPEANELTVHIFAAMAQYERKRISERIKGALQVKRQESNWQPGNPDNFTDAGRRKGIETIKHNAWHNKANRHAYHFIKPLREKGLSWSQIAKELNTEGYRTRTGKRFMAATCRNLYRRYEPSN